MKANELRIGNWVSIYNNNNELKLSQIDILDLQLLLGIINAPFKIQPIPLTEEWLLKFGFEIGRESSIMKNWKIGFNNITHDWLFNIIWIKDIYDNNKELPFYRNGIHKIEFVHQLQNLYFALTGEELTINQ